MNEIKDFVEQLLMQIGLSAELASVTRHVVLVIGAILLAWFVGWLFKLLIPWVNKLTRRTEAKWDDVVFNEQVLRAACQIVPAIVVWLLLPSVFAEYPTAHMVLARRPPSATRAMAGTTRWATALQTITTANLSMLITMNVWQDSVLHRLS